MATSPVVPVVAPGDLITAAHLNNIRSNLDRLDTTKLSLTGGTVTGPLNVNGNIVVTFASTFRVMRAGSTRPFVEFFDAAGAVRYGSIVGASDGTEVSSEVGAIKLMPTNGAASSAEAFRVEQAQALFGKQTSNLGVSGLEITIPAGSVRSTTSNTTMNYYGNHVSAADANGVNFAQFCRVATPIGGISQVATTGVAFNTTSDERLKTVTGSVDGDAALAKVAAMNPVQFTWNEAPDAGPQIGFLAQQLVDVAPEAVTEGVGAPGDEPDPDTGDAGFVPWMTDLAKLVPTLVAAVQALSAKVAVLEGAGT